MPLQLLPPLVLQLLLLLRLLQRLLEKSLKGMEEASLAPTERDSNLLAVAVAPVVAGAEVEVEVEVEEGVEDSKVAVDTARIPGIIEIYVLPPFPMLRALSSWLPSNSPIPFVIPH